MTRWGGFAETAGISQWFPTSSSGRLGETALFLFGTLPEPAASVAGIAFGNGAFALDFVAVFVAAEVVVE
ncbi:MAG: hypothetical protein JJU20_13775, partial [Opitutales bacterium]|nr:hypothetical protein [Opitutales bacterium]